MNTTKEIAIAQLKQVFQHLEVPFGDAGVRANVNIWYANKGHLLNMFRKHPNWDEKSLSIILPDARENTRDTVTQKQDSLNNLIDTLIQTYGEEKMSFMRDNKRPFMERRVTQSHVDLVVSAIPELAQGIKVGMKMTKMLRKICEFNGINVEEKEDVRLRFIAYADAINIEPIIKPLVFSLNPADYVTASNGNSWSSCQVVGGVSHYSGSRYNGDYCAGVMSYLCDGVTVVSYTLPSIPNDTSTMSILPKLSRQLFHIHEDGQSFIQARLYPHQWSKQRYRELRAYMHEILSTCWEFENKWAAPKRRGNRIASTGCGLHYDDYFSFSNDVTLSYTTHIREEVQAGRYDGTVIIGNDPTCIICGESEIEGSSYLTCYNCC